MLKTEDFERELKRLTAEIPLGSNLWLDSYRKTRQGESRCTSSINRQVRAFFLYRTYAETGSRFLDWGCRQAWASCMVRMVNQKAAVEGCDITDAIPESMRNFAGIKYTQLQHAWKLPYADNSFDRVICSGVLEHVPLLNSSLIELNRVTETGGYLLITFLPNRFSYTEFVSRNFFKRSWHRRLYTRTQIKTKLLEHGFDPVDVGFHQFLPSLTSGNRLQWAWAERALLKIFELDPLAESIWPLKFFGANIYAIARKSDYM
jgi:ubiquinone/menaquinone biosynthesis C-methylase UbiE